MQINCPPCQQAMQSVVYSGVSVKFCMKCKNFLLKEKQLDSIMNEGDYDITEEAPSTLTAGGTAPYQCPACQSSMQRKKKGLILQTEIDICDDCGANWISKTALNRMQYDAAVVKHNRDKNQGKIITCPKCGLEQDNSDICKRCNIIFSKYKKRVDQNVVKTTPKGFFDKIGFNMEKKLKKARQSTRAQQNKFKRFFDACHRHWLSHYSMKILSYVFVLASAYIIWLILTYTFSNISMAPPKPKGYYEDLSRVSIFYIFAICMAGPIVLTIAFVLWRLFWFSLYGPIQALVHHFFHPLIKPLISILLLLIVLQSVSLFANGFWVTYWWVNQQFEQASSHKL